MTDHRPVETDDDDIDAQLAATDDVLAGSLAQLLAPPADLEARTQSRVTTSLMSRSLLGTGADLLSVGWQTVRLLWIDPDEEHDEEVTR